jgi:hypothetical protein
MQRQTLEDGSRRKTPRIGSYISKGASQERGREEEAAYNQKEKNQVGLWESLKLR